MEADGAGQNDHLGGFSRRKGITMFRILVADKLAQEGLDILQAEKDVTVDVKVGLKPDELAKVVGEYDGLIIRSGAKVTAEVLEHSGRLKAIARAGVGVDNVDVPTATRKGVVVMNTPDGNTISTAEQTITLMFGLARHLYKACDSLKKGEWERNKFMGRQLEGKTLGVVGLGRVGRAVAERALGLGMRVVGFDPYFSPTESSFKGRVELVEDVNALCKQCDYLTVHTPLTEQTKGIVGAEQLGLMKKSAAVINCARGGIIDEEALYQALTAGTISAAALDVYSEEPPKDRRLVELENVVCTPHLGASTKEAQVVVAIDAAKQVLKVLKTGEVINAVNAPGFDASLAKVLRPYASLAQRMGKILGSVTQGRTRKLKVVYSGEMAELEAGAVTVSLLVGLLQGQSDEPVNAVNARLFIKERGIEVEEIKSHAAGDFATLIEATLETDKEQHSVTGTVFSRSLPRIVAIDDYRMEMVPAGRMIISFNDDKPGVIGGVGNLFGQHKINIGSLTFGRKTQTQKAVLVLALDQEPSQAILREMSELPFMDGVNYIELPELETEA